MISCEFCEIFKNTFFTEHLQTTASVFHARKTWRFQLAPVLLQDHLFRGRKDAQPL